MPSAIGLVAMAALLGCIGCDAMTVVHNATTNFTCTAENGLPIWHVNGTTVINEYGCKQSIDTGNELPTGILTVDGNRICDTLSIYCGVLIEQQILIVYNTTLEFQDHLPSPENLHINEAVDTLTWIEWNPPYSAMNNKSGIIHVDPHITQYTVYITDIYAGSVIRENVTETRYTSNIQDDGLCPIYQVSAWNAGGEGELSEPVQGSIPRVPHNVVAGSIVVRAAVEPNVLHIHINDVDDVCISRMPKYFLITVSSDERVFNETRQHQPGQAVANFNISLPQGVDVCSLHVSISAGNSAGMSSPSEAVEVDCPDDSTDSTTTASASTGSTGSTVTGTGSEREGSRQQGVSTTLIVSMIIGGIAVVSGVLILAVGIICCMKHKKQNRKVKHSDNTYTESPSLGGPIPLYKPPVTDVIYVSGEQTASIPVARVPELQTHSSYSPTSSPSTISGESVDFLIPPSPRAQAPVRSPNLVYAHINVQQTQVSPPANDDHVHYAQLKHQDKM